MNSFISDLSTSDAKAIGNMRRVIAAEDAAVVESIGKIISVERCLVYKQDDVFKYGLARTQKYFSFHSMVMYSDPDIHAFISTSGTHLKMQKGCVTFAHVRDFPLELFREVIARSAAIDFSPLIKHYKNQLRANSSPKTPSRNGPGKICRREVGQFGRQLANCGRLRSAPSDRWP